MNLIESVTSTKIGKLIAEAVSNTSSPKMSAWASETHAKQLGYFTSKQIIDFIEKNPSEDFTNIIYERSGEHLSLLSILVICHEFAGFKAMLDAGADPNNAYWENYSILEYISRNMDKKLLPFLEELVIHGINYDEDAWKRIFYNVVQRRDEAKIFKALYDMVHINLNDEYGYGEFGHKARFVDIAFMKCNAPVVEAMVDFGVKFQKDSDGKYPWDYTALWIDKSKQTAKENFVSDLESVGLHDIADKIPLKNKPNQKPRRDLKHLFEWREVCL